MTRITQATLLLGLLSGSQWPNFAAAVDCTVANSNDSGGGSLRSCISVATNDADVVTIPSSVTSPIGLTSGPLNILAGIVVQGAGPNTSVIDGSGNGINRTFNISAPLNKTVEISGVTLRGAALSPASGAAIFLDKNTLHLSNCIVADNSTSGVHGGAIFSNGIDATIRINSCQFTNNRVQGAGSGGAIYSNGSLLINDSNFSQNFTQAGMAGDGGALYLAGGIGQIINSTFSGNIADQDGGAIYHNTTNSLLIHNSSFDGNTSTDGLGGGIYNDSDTLIMTNSDLTNNTGGGGIYNDDILLIDSSFISGNSDINYDGGGILNDAELILQNSEVSHNSVTTGRGGVIYINGEAIIQTVTVAFNDSDLDGGGIYVHSGSNTTSLGNLTIFGNEAALNGGGIFTAETTFFNNLTITNNTAGQDGGGILTDFVVIFSNSLIGGNFDDGGNPDCAVTATHTMVSLGPNLIEDPTGCSFTGDTGQVLVNQDPLLAAALANNGGPGIGRDGAHPILTLALEPGSPALEAGDNTTCLPTDQRGVVRPQGVNCDLGSFEEGASADLSLINLTFGEQVVGTTSDPLSATLTNNGPLPLQINDIAVAGLDAGDFLQDNDCGDILAANSACTISATFSPLATGVRQAEIIVDTSANLQRITLLGSGISPGPPPPPPPVNDGCSLHPGAGGASMGGLIFGLALLALALCRHNAGAKHRAPTNQSNQQ